MEKEYFMKEALKEAKKAYKKLEVPVGVVIVKDGRIIARGHNQKESKNSPIMHAEIMAIEKACRKLDNWRLNDCEMYITLEPCAMCAGAIMNSRIKKIYIGAMEHNSGACGSKLNLLQDYEFETQVEIETNVMKEECENILKQFFKEIRANKTKEKNNG